MRSPSLSSFLIPRLSPLPCLLACPMSPHTVPPYNITPQPLPCYCSSFPFSFTSSHHAPLSPYASSFSIPLFLALGSRVVSIYLSRSFLLLITIRNCCYSPHPILLLPTYLRTRAYRLPPPRTPLLTVDGLATYTLRIY